MADIVSFRKFDAELMVAYDTKASKLLGKDYWRVQKGFHYYLGEKGSNRWVFIPAGYLTDGASVPQIFWSVIPQWGAYGQAAVVHDYLCEYLSITVDGKPQSITRSEADDILLEAMRVLEVPEFTAQTIEAAVDFYRVITQTSTPSNKPLKRQLEAEWAKGELTV
jgi:hypothetical protein